MFQGLWTGGAYLRRPTEGKPKQSVAELSQALRGCSSGSYPVTGRTKEISSFYRLETEGQRY